MMKLNSNKKNYCSKFIKENFDIFEKELFLSFNKKCKFISIYGLIFFHRFII